MAREEGEGKPLFQNKNLLAPGPGLKKLQVSPKVAIDLESINQSRCRGTKHEAACKGSLFGFA